MAGWLGVLNKKEAHPKAAICIPELWSGLTSLDNNQLLPETGTFGD